MRTLREPARELCCPAGLPAAVPGVMIVMSLGGAVLFRLRAPALERDGTPDRANVRPPGGQSSAHAVQRGRYDDLRS